MLLAFVMSILMMILQLVLSIPQIIIVAMLSLQSPQLVLSVRLVMQLFVYGVVIRVSLRLSMAAPMTFAERKLRIFESWELTKGHTLSLLGVGFLISLALPGMLVRRRSYDPDAVFKGTVECVPSQRQP